jgi:two-component system nitrogen regulation sensor histidine kinase GlnL
MRAEQHISNATVQDNIMANAKTFRNEWFYLQSVPVAVLLIGSGQALLRMNPAAEAMLQIAESSLAGRPVSALFPDDAALLALIGRVASQHEAVTEYDHLLKTLRAGEIRTTVRLVPVAAEDGADEMLLVMDPPAMAQRFAQGAMQKEILRTAGLMAAMLAHEVKNPLSGIRGAAQLLQQDASEENQPLAELICREVDRIKGLVDQMEFLSDHSEIRREPVNIHEVLQYAQSVARSGFARGIPCREHYDPSLPYVLGSRDMLVQVFLNLMKNAAEASRPVAQPEITLATSARSLYRVRSPDGARTGGLMIAVTVEDNGAGIPDEVREKLFEPFVSTKMGKRGLGLAIVSKILADIGGGIELERSVPGCTRFCVYLPGVKETSGGQG